MDQALIQGIRDEEEEKLQDLRQKYLTLIPKAMSIPYSALTHDITKKLAWSEETGSTLFRDWRDLAALLGVGSNLDLKSAELIAKEKKILPLQAVLLYKFANKGGTLGTLLNALLQREDCQHILWVILDDIRDFVKRYSATTFKQSYTGDIVEATKCPQIIPADSLNCVSKENTRTIHVLLTNTADVLDVALEWKRHIQSSKSQQCRFVVSLDSEQTSAEQISSTDFWPMCLQKVDFIIILVNKTYLQRIQPVVQKHAKNWEQLETRRIRYIFTICQDWYIKDGCMNRRVRPVLLNDVDPYDDQFYSYPILSCYHAVCDGAEQLCKCLYETNMILQSGGLAQLLG